MTGYPVPSQDGAPQTWTAIDIAKDAHVVLLQSSLRLSSRSRPAELLAARLTLVRGKRSGGRVTRECSGAVWKSGDAWRYNVVSTMLLLYPLARRPSRTLATDVTDANCNS